MQEQLRISTLLVAGMALALAPAPGCGRSGALGDESDRTVIRNKGSDSMVIAAVAWSERYDAVRPGVSIAVGGGGTGTGIAGLINGTVDVANATRKLKPDEIEQIRGKGYDPVEFVVGFDAPAFVVHEDNPVDSLTLGQLAEIYGTGGRIESWDQLGVDVPGCSSGEIVRVSRQSSSGTNEYLRRAVLGPGRDYKLGTRDMQGSKDVVELVSKTPCAIGYTGMAYAPPARVKMPCLARDRESPCVVPSMQGAVDGSYPISRPLLLYAPGPLTGAVAEFIDWVQSDEGQCIVRRVGYAPMRPVSCPDPDS